MASLRCCGCVAWHARYASLLSKTLLYLDFISISMPCVRLEL